MSLFRFIGVAIGAGAIMALTSLVWPRVTSQPRPEALTKVRENVLETQVGQGVANLLGVTDELGAEPININSAVTTGTSIVIDSMKKSAQHAVVSQVMESVVKQFNQFSEEDKASFRAQICEPPAE